MPARRWHGVPEAEDPEGLAVARIEFREQRREVARATLWLDPDDRELLGLWWLELAGLPGRAEPGVAPEPRPQQAMRVQLARTRLDDARILARALASSTPAAACPGLRSAMAGWDGEPSSLWRRRGVRHVEECERCGAVSTALVPADHLVVTTLQASPLR